ncbi:hypothetical protein KFL_003710110 [Klebsormidium nitens]|uniref:Uncharacterized protein n=1 Tax=Klebsormidium nitens TaxID=105231 RepID=A0A1Y1I9R8_KLENI|nr:hypothetical protein KFL_003710110 [Klebsormidium nitens]|eukprot:GAQ87705.1 hypothetical protein KFL_003710110 [Klebsormidium nitens]
MVDAAWLPPAVRREATQRLLLLCVITAVVLGGPLLVTSGGCQLGSLASFRIAQIVLESSNSAPVTPSGLSQPEETRTHALALLRAQSWGSAFHQAKLLETVGYMGEEERPTGLCYENRSMADFTIQAEDLRAQNVSTFVPLYFNIQEAKAPSPGKRGLGGKYFYISVEGRPWADPGTVVRLPQPLVWDHSNGSYTVAFEVYDEDVTYNITVSLWHAGYAGYLGNLRDFHWGDCCPALPQMTFLESFTFSTRIMRPDQANATTAPNHGQSRGRWLNDYWEPADCPYTQFSNESLRQCAERNGPFHITLVGDSLMRGLFFDTREILSGKRPDQSQAGHHDEEPVEEAPGFTLEFKWTPHSAALHPRLQNGDFFSNTSSVLVFNTLQWDLARPSPSG